MPMWSKRPFDAAAPGPSRQRSLPASRSGRWRAGSGRRGSGSRSRIVLKSTNGHAVEADRVVAEPAPGQLRILAAAEAVLSRREPDRRRQVGRRSPSRASRLPRPVGDDLAVDPGHDVLARVALGRLHEACPRRGCRSARRESRLPGSGGRRPAADAMTKQGENDQRPVMAAVRHAIPRHQSARTPARSAVCCRRPQSAARSRGVEVLVVQLKPAETPFQRERRTRRPRASGRRRSCRPSIAIIDSTMMTGDTYCPRQYAGATRTAGSAHADGRG